MEKLQVTKYLIDDIVLIFGDGSTDTIPAKNINHITLSKNFFDLYLPIFILNCNVDYELYKRINKEKPKYKIKIKKFNIASNAYEIEEERILSRNFIDNIFQNVNETDVTPNLYENILKEKNENREDERPSVEKDAMQMELILFKENSLSDYRTVTDVIYNRTSIINVIMALLMDANQSNCLISYPDNRSVYDNIIIPNDLTLIGAVEYLQNIYGIYNTGLCLFNDLNKLYLLNKNMECNAYQRQEHKIVYIQFEDATKAEGNIYGMVEDDRYKRYKIVCQSHPIISSNETQISNLAYDEILMIDTFTGSKQYKKISKNVQANNNKNIKIIDNKYSNEYAANAMIYDINLNNNIMEIEFNELDIDILTPNKEYYIDFKINDKDISKLKGIYKLVSYVAVFEKQDETKFYNAIKATFKRA